MVGAEKMEQRGQAVKRLRSLFDMHHVPFGAPENLGGVLLSLHENRHFAMDFWSIVNALSAQETGAPSEEEMLETVIESATGRGAAALPEYERPGVTELRLMLAGVDTTRPVELPDAIHKPGDSLPAQHAMPNVEPNVEEDAKPERTHTKATRRSIGEALAKLEQTSRELREQLASLDENAIGEARPSSVSGVDHAEAKPKSVVSREPRPADEEIVRGAESVPVAQLPFVIPVAAQVAKERTEEQRPEERAVIANVPEKTAREYHAPLPKPLQSDPAAGTEVFARKPVRTLSHRGLAISEPDDDPSIIAPLSSYGEQQESGSMARYVIVAVVVGAIAAGGFFAARTDTGHSMMTSAASSLRSTYAKAKTTLGLSTGNAQLESQPKVEPEAATPTTPAAVPDANQPPAESGATGSSVSQTVGSPQPQTSSDVKTPTPSAAPAEQPSVRKQHDEEAIAAARSVERQQAEEAASAGLQRVPASTMASSLIASRVPAYPEAARAQGIEGPVELEIVVTRTGDVKYAHAIDGDRHLRAAAEEAVMKWRYRPYIQNGSAMEIVTTARVVFRLPQ